MARKRGAVDLTAWNALALESLSLWTEANTVIWLRLMRMAGGGALAEQEASRMVSEKIAAHAQLGMRLMLGGWISPEQAARKSVRHYRGKVRANRRRLKA